jgi:glycosyltransferase involved in cell wall biosynthesis
MKSTEGPVSILMVSTADWDNPYWTNKQHVAMQLAQRGHKILYVESLGLRRPTATQRDLHRIWRRLKRGFRPPRAVHENIWVWSPVIVPLHNLKLVRWFNRIFLSISQSIASRLTGIKPRMLWAYSPLTTEFYDANAFDFLVYHAVDDVKAQPGMPREAILVAEAELTRRSNVVFTTAPNLFEMHRTVNPETYFFPNVADYEHFSKARLAATVVPDDLAAISGPRVGFVGAISGYKLDLPLIRAVADSRPDMSFVMIGEVGEGDPWTDASLLMGAPNVHLMGGRSYGSLPAYLKGMDVAILPSLANEYTRSMFPMKFFEYLAAGLPLVGTPLPALSGYSDVAIFREGADSFAQGLDEALAGGGPSLEVRLAAARDNTYEKRTDKMMAIVDRLWVAKGLNP